MSNETQARFRINWHGDGARYTVSIPNYDGGEVVRAEVADALVAALEYIRDLGADGADRKFLRAQAKAEHVLASLCAMKESRS